MKYTFQIFILIASSVLFAACKKKETSAPVIVPPKFLSVSTIQLDGASWSNRKYGVKQQTIIKVRFSEKVKQSTVATALKLAVADRKSVV